MTKPGRLDLRTVAETDVYLGDDLTAHLVREPADTISFTYIAEQRPTQAGIRARSVSWSLLRSREYPVVTTGGAVPAFFAGLLPEGVRLGVATSSTKTSAMITSRCCWRSALTPSATSGSSRRGSSLLGRCRCLIPSATRIFVRSSRS